MGSRPNQRAELPVRLISGVADYSCNQEILFFRAVKRNVIQEGNQSVSHFDKGPSNQRHHNKFLRLKFHATDVVIFWLLSPFRHAEEWWPAFETKKKSHQKGLSLMPHGIYHRYDFMDVGTRKWTTRTSGPRRTGVQTFLVCNITPLGPDVELNIPLSAAVRITDANRGGD